MKWSIIKDIQCFRYGGRLLWITFSYLNISCSSVHAEVPKVSEMQCGDAIVRIESYCKMDSKENQLSCSKQVLSFEDQKTHKKNSRLLQDEPEFLGSPISEWACSQGKSGKYIEVMRCLAGNCGIGNAIEFEIWSLDGKLLAPYDISFSRKIKKTRDSFS